MFEDIIKHKRLLVIFLIASAFVLNTLSYGKAKDYYGGRYLCYRASNNHILEEQQFMKQTGINKCWVFYPGRPVS
jgi:hypothetical protein